MKKWVLVLFLLLVLGGGALILVASGDEITTPSSATPDPGLEEFLPSERLPADSAISFPVDI